MLFQVLFVSLLFGCTSKHSIGLLFTRAIDVMVIVYEGLEDRSFIGFDTTPVQGRGRYGMVNVKLL